MFGTTEPVMQLKIDIKMMEDETRNEQYIPRSLPLIDLNNNGPILI